MGISFGSAGAIGSAYGHCVIAAAQTGVAGESLRPLKSRR